MSWEKGNQSIRMDYAAKPLNASILAIEGDLKDEESKYLLYKFLRANIPFTCELFFGVKLFPFQALAIKGMMVADYSMFVFSRGLSKTFSTAIYVLLECLLSPDCQIGVIAGTFRQSKMIFQKIEDILSKPEAALAAEAGFKISKGTDMWTLKCEGGNRAVALPLANGERLRGFRFSRIVLDEFLTIPDKIFNEVIIPFLGVNADPVIRQEMDDLESRAIAAGEMEESERYEWPHNKLILLSSPSFKFEYMYKLFKQYEALILGLDDVEIEDGIEGGEGAYRLIMQLSYDCAPKQLYDQNLLKQAKATMSEMQFQREFGAQFVEESDGYFRLSKMAAATVADGSFPAAEIAGMPKDEYVLAFDPNWSGNSSADFFAMQVFKLNRDNNTACLVHSYALAGVDLKFHMRYFLYIIQNFNIVGMVGDYNGGVQFINSCNESELFKSANIHIGVLEVAFDKPEDYREDLLTFKNTYNASEKMYCILRKPSSSWIRIANEQLQGAIEHKRILFGARAVDDHFDSQRKKNVPVSKIKWTLEDAPKDKDAALIDFLDTQKSNIELTKTQCANIEVTTNPQGSQSFDLPQNMKRQKGPHRARKDCYSALVLGNWFIKIMYDADAAENKKSVTATFLPFSV